MDLRYISSIHQMFICSEGGTVLVFFLAPLTSSDSLHNAAISLLESNIKIMFFPFIKKSACKYYFHFPYSCQLSEKKIKKK